MLTEQLSILAVGALILFMGLGQGAGECCNHISISSNSHGRGYQEHQLGVYTQVPGLTVNERPVYKQNKGDQYVYYWVFGEGRHDDGENWLVSNDYDNWRHGIESPNMKWEYRDGENGAEAKPCVEDDCGNRCVSEVNKNKVPFSVWTVLHRNWGWVVDTTLRVECYSKARAVQCCQSVRLRSSGLTGVYHPGLLGVYTMDDYNSGQNITQHSRPVYRQIDGDHFLYYWDWGPNSGTNWMVSHEWWKGDRSLESSNVETHVGLNVCPEDVHTVGPFSVWNTADRAWQSDWGLRLECFHETMDGIALDCCDKVGLLSTGPLLHQHPDTLDEYTFYTGRNGRTVFRSSSGSHYLYYHDWGSNMGANWMVSTDYSSSKALLTSPNVENLDSSCVEGVHNITSYRPFLVSSPLGWLEDKSLRMECVQFEDKTNPILALYKSKLRKANDHNRNVVIYNY